MRLKSEQLQELPIIRPLLKDILMIDTPEHNMVDARTTLFSCFSWHNISIDGAKIRKNLQTAKKSTQKEPSLLCTTGSYKLCFQSEGDATLTIGVKIQKLTSPNNTVLEATVQVGSVAVLPFDIADGWGEYQITFTRPSATTDITISNIGIYSRTDEETTAIVATQNNKNDHYLFDLQGRQVTNPQHGLYIINGKKIVVR